MQEVSLVFPNQLFYENPILSKNRVVALVEEPTFFTKFRFHKQKIVLHRASLRAYQHYLLKLGYTVKYFEFKDDYKLFLTEFSKIHYVDSMDSGLEKELNNFFTKSNLGFEKYESPSFLTDINDFKAFFKDKKTYQMTPFYIWQRKHLNILITDEKPVGEKWTFDKDNREKLPINIKIPEVIKLKENEFVREAKRYVNEHFFSNPGTVMEFNYPTTFKDAHLWLDDFLENRFKNFGVYEDAFEENRIFLFHSLLSSSLNNGLLTPQEVVSKTLEYSAKNKIPLNSLEGFLRQIIGWREYVRCMYLIKGEQERKSNFFDAKNPIPESFYDASTGIAPLDSTINKVLTHAYCHHIERLMILSNFMSLSKIAPNEIYRWFMEMFIDAYDWVMVPNVYGMGTYADGGLIMSKPYVSSSNYLKKMSHLKDGKWSEIWDSMYWQYIYKNKRFFENNPRLRIMARYLDRISRDKIQNHLNISRKFLGKLFRK